MKVLQVAFCFFLSLNSFSQVDCSKYKTGKFVVKSEEFGNNYIKRTKKYQIETSTNPQTGAKTKTKDRVVWLNECTYQLIPIKTKDPDNIIKDNILTFEITEAGSDYYIVHVSGIENFEIDAKVEVQ